MIFKTLRGGARGYLSKDATISDLVKAIQAVHRGELWVERKLIGKFFGGEGLELEEDQRGKKEALTAREQEVLRFLASGNTNKDIAKALSISEKGQGSFEQRLQEAEGYPAPPGHPLRDSPRVELRPFSGKNPSNDRLTLARPESSLFGTERQCSTCP